ncbi:MULTISPECIES: site-specific integrase [unclassified Thioalkalivibrio]|uniref:tyrosine-type recombinase/integrase n=1 Tax=unclassified Thioalkalivibrio TaxID=2621013 RepID=UPI001E352E86|nr:MULTISPECIES: site-specific integrase [unclassified Thioalkalivibrio]
MPVQPRGRSYEASVSHKGERYRRMFPSRTQAEMWEAESKAALLRGELPDLATDEAPEEKGKPRTLKELFDATYRSSWAGIAAEKSIVTGAKQILEYFGPNTRFTEIREEQIDGLVFMWEARGLANGTINKRLSILSMMLRHAHDRQWVSRVPKMPRKKTVKGRIRYFTEQEEQHLIEYFKMIDQPDLADLVVIGVDTGMRMGEILRAEYRDVHDGILSIWKTKNGEPRSVPLTSRARAVIARRQKDGHQRIFHGWSYAQIRHYWDRARSHMGMAHDPQFVMHVMRHTFCSRLIQKGVSIVIVKELAGHSTVVVTMRYAHLAPANLVSAIRALEKGEDSAEYCDTRNPDVPQPCGIR